MLHGQEETRPRPWTGTPPEPIFEATSQGGVYDEARNHRGETMKKLTIALLGSIAFFSPVPGLRGVAAAQTGVTRIAYDQCLAAGGNWGEVLCYIGMAVDGTDALVADGVGPKWSPDGSRIAFTDATPGPNISTDILVLNLADGSITNLTNNFPVTDWGPVWSRDGGTIAFVSDRDGSLDLYVMGANGGNPTRVTHNVGFTGPFAWSPDGGRFAFASDRDGAPELYVTNAAGSNLTRLTNNVRFNGPFSWSPDGSRIAFDCLVDGGADVCAVNSDGTNFVRLTSDPAKDSGAVFSPVDDRIAFVTERFGTGPEIAVMDAGGAATRVAAGTGGTQPVWSRDGNRLIFVSTIPSFYTGICYFGGGAHNADDFCIPVYGMYLVNADGTGLTATASGADPDWFTSLPGQPVAAFTYDCSGVACDFDAAGSFDPDGTVSSYLWQFGDGSSSSTPTAHHTYDTGETYGVSLTVTDNSGATGIVRVVVRANSAPVASFTVACSGPTCTFDGSGSSDPDGTIASYSWYFGDGNWGYGATVNHTYSTGTFSATLMVADNSGTTGTALQTLTVVNAPPVATFTSTCSGLTCSFNASGSSDPDGTIASYAWNFGDATTDSGATVSHMFAADGTYSVLLTVTDNGAATSTQAQSVTVVQPAMHVGDLDRASTIQQSTWTATVTITVHTSSHGPIANAAVSGAWSDGSTGSCATNASGQCVVSKTGIPKRTGSVNFTVTNVALGMLVYKPADNHDPDGDSNGTSISVIKQ